MTIDINKVHFPVTVLGYGRRLGIWVQGCSIRCPGCISQDTWEPGGGRIEVGTLLECCRAAVTGPCDGVTISGGEPFDQPDGLEALVRGLRAWGRTRTEPFDIFGYSGYPLALLQGRWPNLVALFDALVPDPFRRGEARPHAWAGSGNQSIVPLTDLGAGRYAAHLVPNARSRRLQVHVDDRAVWLIGIPDSRDLDEVVRRCAGEGVVLGERSWRA